MRKATPARATRIEDATQARATLKSIGNAKDRGKAELAILKKQAATGQSRQEILAEQVARRHTRVGGQKLADALEAFGLTFDGLKGGPVVTNKTKVLTNKLTQSRPNVNES